MAAWVALFKKDFRLTRTVFFVGLVINFLILLLALYVDIIPIYTLVSWLVFHVLYLPIMLFISLKTEAGQLHLWLHNPQSAATLFLSKILNGIDYDCCILSCTISDGGNVDFFKIQFN